MQRGSSAHLTWAPQFVHPRYSPHTPFTTGSVRWVSARREEWGRERRGGGKSEKTEEEGEGWREGEETAQQTPNTSPRRFTAMRYSYLCLIDCIGGGSSTMCRPFQRATLTPLFPFFSAGLLAKKNYVILTVTASEFPSVDPFFLLLFYFTIVFESLF